MNWTATAADFIVRLDVFLVARLPDRSRSAIQKAIKGEQVTVNSKPVTVHRFLKAGDVIEWLPMEDRREKTEDKKAELEVGGWKLEVVRETPGWLVINKPAGLLVHPDAKNHHGTLVDLLLAHDPKICRVGADPDRPGIVHRLDREVSGLMVVAKTQAAYESLQAQFAQRHVKKTYLALVHGRVSRDQGDIKLSIGRSTTKPRMAAKTVSGQGRAAWTHFRVLKRLANTTLLEVEILSGRTHQIRAHLHAIGHPVVGDQLYVIKHPGRKNKAPRLMLQSLKLEFDDPSTGERQKFELAPAPEFKTAPGVS